MVVPLVGSEAALEACIASGGVAVFPTDTVYGLCCDPENVAAVRRLYTLKGRAADKPAALLFFALDPAIIMLPWLGQRAQSALRALLPGAVTVLLPDPERRFPLAGGRLLGVRVIDVGLSLELPVLQSSANRSGAGDPRRLADIPSQIREAADLVIDGGELPGVPSTVVDLSELERGGGWHVLREGALSKHQLDQRLRGI
jgi:L-threonylcarbamoyladenylate synthase